MKPTARFYDAHNHLQDDRFAGRQETILRAAAEAGVARMVVNGAFAADWPAVTELARSHPGLVQPSFGWHPWYLDERGPDWENALARQLNAHPDAFVGEIGLDRWMLDNPDRWRALLANAGQNKEAPLPWRNRKQPWLPNCGSPPLATFPLASTACTRSDACTNCSPRTHARSGDSCFTATADRPK